MQAWRKIDNKKKFTNSQIAAWIWHQEEGIHENIETSQIHMYTCSNWQPFLNEIIVKLEWTEVNSQERTERAESLLILYSDNLELARTAVVLHGVCWMPSCTLF